MLKKLAFQAINYVIIQYLPIVSIIITTATRHIYGLTACARQILTVKNAMQPTPVSLVHLEVIRRLPM